MLLETIGIAIGLDQSEFAFFAFYAVSVLHAKNPVVSFFAEMLEDIPVIDLTCSGFFSSGIVSDVEGGYFGPCTINIRYEVALGDLLMVQVVYDLTAWVVYGFANLV